jgi:hypothetical protein
MSYTIGLDPNDSTWCVTTDWKIPSNREIPAKRHLSVKDPEQPRNPNHHQDPSAPMEIVPITLAKSDIEESDDPYHRLGDLTWLRKQKTKKEVQGLLIDCFRLYHTRQLSRKADCATYSENLVNRTTFRSFLQKAAEKKVLPDWWRTSDLRECVFLSMIRGSESSLELLRTEEDIEKEYDCMMPELLYILACKIYGTGTPDHEFMKLLREKASTTFGTA